MQKEKNQEHQRRYVPFVPPQIEGWRKVVAVSAINLYVEKTSVPQMYHLMSFQQKLIDFELFFLEDWYFGFVSIAYFTFIRIGILKFNKILFSYDNIKCQLVDWRI